MTIKEIIKEIVEALVISGDTYAFRHADKGWQNLVSDKESLPFVYLDDPIKWDYTFSVGSVLEKVYDLKMMIGYKTQLDNTPEQHQVLVEKAVLCADAILNKLRLHSEVRGLKEVKGIEFINVFDLNCSGVFLTLNITLRNSNSIC